MNSAIQKADQLIKYDLKIQKCKLTAGELDTSRLTT